MLRRRRRQRFFVVRETENRLTVLTCRSRLFNVVVVVGISSLERAVTSQLVTDVFEILDWGYIISMVLPDLVRRQSQCPSKDFSFGKGARSAAEGIFNCKKAPLLIKAPCVTSARRFVRRFLGPY